MCGYVCVGKFACTCTLVYSIAYLYLSLCVCCSCCQSRIQQEKAPCLDPKASPHFIQRNRNFQIKIIPALTAAAI